MVKRKGGVKSRNIRRTASGIFSQVEKSSVRIKASKFLAGMATRRLVGGGIFGLAAAYLVSDIEGLAGAFVGDALLATIMPQAPQGSAQPQGTQGTARAISLSGLIGSGGKLLG